MMGLIRNESEKLLRQWRFVVVLSLYTLLALITSLDIHKASFPQFTAANTVFQWVTGGFAGVLIPFSVSILVGDIFAGEYSSGTIKLLLVRPVSRRKIWLSKYLAALGVSVLSVLYLGLCLYVCLGVSLGWGSWSAPLPAEVETEYATVWALTWRVYALESLAVAALVSFVLLVSAMTRTGIAAVGTCVGAILLGFLTVNSAGDTQWVKYLLAPHLEVTNHLVRQFSLPGCSLLQSVVTLCVWAVACAAAGLWFFQKRYITE